MHSNPLTNNQYPLKNLNLNLHNPQTAINTVEKIKQFNQIRLQVVCTTASLTYLEFLINTKLYLLPSAVTQVQTNDPQYIYFKRMDNAFTIYSAQLTLYLL